ncbi:Rv1733c family protein [Streptomyces sp. NBC_00536]|uniref:Rv1733c family protein n=1 Tax=Streptomyces sp. NBC_00536 TaxID=2975769 RepID=UPI002E82397B|nr:hypothetical protein [Streptomyces sp. NBC_00536]
MTAANGRTQGPSPTEAPTAGTEVGYDAVVLGGALYAGHWSRTAKRRAERDADALKHRPVWLLSSGPLDRSAEPATSAPSSPPSTERSDQAMARRCHMFETPSEKDPRRRPGGRRPNPLRRAADRTRTRWLAAFRLFLLVAVVCGVAAGTAVRDAEARTAQAEALHRHRVSAMTTDQADRVLSGRFSNTRTAMAQASWEYPASHRHTARILVPDGTPAGGAVTLWVDDTGQVTPAPRPDAEVVSTAVAAGAAVSGLLALSAGGLVWFKLRCVDADCLNAWDRAWEDIEPRWSGRLRSEPGANDS